MPEVIIGKDEGTGQLITIGDIERRSGLYILGKPGMGKSALIVNMLNTDIEHGHGTFFLDPHGDAISDLLKRGDNRLLKDTRLFDIEDEDFSFGINLLMCKNIKSLKERTDTYTRAYNVFYKLWEQEWGPWLQLILQNTLWAFIENQDYTLAEVPMFLNPRNTTFRDHIIENIKYNPAVIDFWKYEFFKRRERDQQERVDAALTRITTLLTHPYVRHIIGQKKTTVDFTEHLKTNAILLFKLSANLSPDIKRFIGSILISELLYSIRNRPENDRGQFCIFVDEFQNFASSDDFTTLITEARKFGIATTLAHVERFGQFADNRKLLGATLAAVNKVFFQLTVKDAEELAPEFAKEPTTTDTRLEPELVISQEPFWDLLSRGHANKQIQEFVYKYWWPVQRHLEWLKDWMETERLKRTALQDQATLYRDQISLSQTDERWERLGSGLSMPKAVSYAVEQTRNAIERTRSAHLNIKEKNHQLLVYHGWLTRDREQIDKINKFLIALMSGYITLEPYNELLAQFLHNMLVHFAHLFDHSFNKIRGTSALCLYIDIMYGDPNIPRTIPDVLAYKYWRKEAEEIYLQRVTKSDQIWDWESQHFEHAYQALRLTEEELIQVKKKHIEKRMMEFRLGFYGACSLPPRIYTESERKTIENNCYDELSAKITAAIDDFIEFCKLLRKPENHIKVPSGQYIEKPVSVRLVSDMTNEMAQELANLPRFSAYTKVIDESGGEQIKPRHNIVYSSAELSRLAGAV